MFRNIPEDEALATVEAAWKQGFATSTLPRSTAPGCRRSAWARRWRSTNGASTCSAPRWAGTREILECWFDAWPLRDEYLIIEGRKQAGTGARSYTVRELPKRLAGAR